MRWLCLVALVLGVSARANAQGTVRTVKFLGNRALDEKLLRASIVTQQAPLFYRLSLTRWIGLARAPAFDGMEFRRDVLRIQALYGVHGFPESKVDTTLRRRHDDLDITFRIAEGPPVIVDSVQIVGLDTLVKVPNIRRLLPLQAGNPFDRIAFQTSVAVLEAWLRDRGHAFARVTGGFAAAADARSVTVTLTADPGPRARIGDIAVEGTEAINKRVVLKLLMIEKGQIYSDSALHAGMMNLQRTELFRQVRLGLVDTAPSNPKDTLVTVHVRAQLADYPLRRARVSAGYGTLDCMRAMGSVDLFNFSGEGRRLELRARTSELGVNQLDHSACRQLLDEDPSRLKINYNLAVTLHDPLISWNRTTGMATVFLERHSEFGAYLREAVGGEVALTRQIATDLPLEGSYSLSYGRTLATPATFCALLNVCSLDDQAIFGARRRRSVVSFQLVRDRSNSINDPTQGSTLVTELRISPAFLGSDEFMRFVRATGGFTAHAPMGNGVFSWRVRAGTVFAPRANVPTGRREYVPPEERLFGAVFVDAGMVAERSHISLGDLRVTPGAGLRMPSLLGPIRLDVGINPYPATAGPLYNQVGNELQLVDPSFRPKLRLIDRFQLHLSIGQAF